MRPDLGRRLAPSAEATLAPHADGYDVVFVVADGLSARAVQTHAQPILASVLLALQADCAMRSRLANSLRRA
jgi:ethanolamine ammonia-lyase small subunit